MLQKFLILHYYTSEHFTQYVICGVVNGVLQKFLTLHTYIYMFEDFAKYFLWVFVNDVLQKFLALHTYMFEPLPNIYSESSLMMCCRSLWYCIPICLKTLPNISSGSSLMVRCRSFWYCIPICLKTLPNISSVSLLMACWRSLWLTYLYVWTLCPIFPGVLQKYRAFDIT